MYKVCCNYYVTLLVVYSSVMKDKVYFKFLKQLLSGIFDFVFKIMLFSSLLHV